jgi:hypothetical protein
MGRFYCGDIEGKFWFGVQSSGDGDFFGLAGKYKPRYGELEYSYKSKHLFLIKYNLNICSLKLGKYDEKIKAFFVGCEGYTDKQLSQYLKVSLAKTKTLLEWYARQELGQKILKSVEEKGRCYFSAEL